MAALAEARCGKPIPSPTLSHVIVGLHGSLMYSMVAPFHLLLTWRPLPADDGYTIYASGCPAPGQPRQDSVQPVVEDEASTRCFVNCCRDMCGPSPS